MTSEVKEALARLVEWRTGFSVGAAGEPRERNAHPYWLKGWKAGLKNRQFKMENWPESMKVSA